MSCLKVLLGQMSRLRVRGGIMRRSDPQACMQLRLQLSLANKRDILSDAEAQFSIAMDSLYLSDITLEDRIELHGQVPTPELEAIRQEVKQNELVAVPLFFSVGLARQAVEDVTVQCLESSSNNWPGIKVVGIDSLTDRGLLLEDTQLQSAPQ